MKVVTKFTFDEPTLRTIRAAHGRGGVASRKECVTFIDRAVREALAKAPDPKPARKRVPKPLPEPKVELTPEQESQQVAATITRLRRLYKVG